MNDLTYENKELKKYAKKLQDEVDYYKHEYYAEQDLNEELREKAAVKEPVWIYDEGNNQVLCCPSCKQHIVNVWNKRKYMPNYCHYCGQRLNWSKFKRGD